MAKNKARHHYPVVVAGLVSIAFAVVALTDFFGVFAGQSSNFALTINPGYECYDGQDNDGNGLEDYPADPGCDSYTDDDESTVVPGSGGGGGSAVPSIYRPTPLPSAIATGSSAFTGVTIPNALVRILQNGIVVAEVRSSRSGIFSVVIPSLGDGLHAFSFITVTESGMSAPMSLSLLRNGNELTETTGIVLPPTVVSNVLALAQGDTLKVSGHAPPSALVRIEVHSDPVFIQTVETKELGTFYAEFETDVLSVGAHAIYASVFIDGVWSVPSLPWRFTVGTETVLAPVQGGLCHADVNRDGRANLIDLSVLEVWFEQPLSDEMRIIEKNCFNGDGKITPIDLSILAYYWTG